jgi:O-antigen ligase
MPFSQKLASLFDRGWAGALFFLPISTAMSGLCIAIATVTGIIQVLRRPALQSVPSLRAASIAMYLVTCYGIFLISIMWTSAPHVEYMEAVSKYTRLLIPALFLLNFCYSSKLNFSRVSMYFIMGVFLCSVISVGTLLGVTEFLLGAHGADVSGWDFRVRGNGILYIGGVENPTFGRNHITQGLFSALAAIMIIYDFVFSPHLKRGRLILGIIGLSFIMTALFALNGRTGGLMFLGGLVLISGKAMLRQGARGLRLAGVLAFAATYALISPGSKVVDRMTTITDYAGISEVKKSVDTSLSDRGLFIKIGYSVALRNLPWGAGIGSFSEEAAKYTIGTFHEKNRLQPHSELIQWSVQLGVFGLLAYLIMIFYALIGFWREPGTERSLLFLLILTILVAGVFNSVIYDMAEGYLLMILISLLVIDFSKPQEGAECRNN